MKLVRFLLFPFAVLYDLITSIRNFFFSVGVFKETTFKIPIIVVGNLSVGGTGKTPQIEYLVRLLKDQFKISVLSRGYKRKTKGFVLVDNIHTADDVGDEPLQYFKKFNNINVAVNENRAEGKDKVIQNNSPEVKLLDDAVQHRKVKGSFYILLTKYNDIFTDDFLLPTGNLRESRAGANRADVIIVTKCPRNLKDSDKKIIERKLKKYNKKIFFSTISYASKISGSKKILIEEVVDFEVLLITGIANPKPLTDFLKSKRIKFKHLKFSDHHNFSQKEINEIDDKFKIMKSDKKLILTTEKDYTRLENFIKDLSYIQIETNFLSDKNEFDNIINSHLK